MRRHYDHAIESARWKCRVRTPCGLTHINSVTKPENESQLWFGIYGNNSFRQYIGDYWIESLRLYKAARPQGADRGGKGGGEAAASTTNRSDGETKGEDGA